MHQNTLPFTNGAALSNRFSRSRELVQMLRREFVYTEKRARDIVFQEIGAALREGAAPRIVSRLTREVAARGRARAEQLGFEFSLWDIAAKATLNAMLGARTLLDRDGQPIRLTIATPATEVWGLAEDFENRTEAYLLELLIRKMGDISARDHTALAHALFRQFDPTVPMDDMEDRVAHLLASLSDRVAVNEAGAYYISA